MQQNVRQLGFSRGVCSPAVRLQRLRPTDEIDAEYGRWLRRIIKAGVEALPYPVRMTPAKIIQTQRLVVKL